MQSIAVELLCIQNYFLYHTVLSFHNYFTWDLLLSFQKANIFVYSTIPLGIMYRKLSKNSF